MVPFLGFMGGRWDKKPKDANEEIELEEKSEADTLVSILNKRRKDGWKGHDIKSTISNYDKAMKILDSKKKEG
ncbi:TPA: hypothetical protein DDZ75_03450 [Patescibacteria group bacterium]|nr:hypothetical protein [Patescibacteria group bacterium]